MAALYLTNRVRHKLLEIENYSEKMWGKKRTAQYMNDILQAMQQLAQKPDIGKLRQNRSQPYLMAPVEQHYAIYKIVEDGIMVVTILHNRQNVEGILGSVGISFTDCWEEKSLNPL